MKTIAIIQARLGSTRLPRKVLCDVAGQSMLEHVVERVSRCRSIDEIVVATSHRPEDRELVQFCQKRKWAWYAGSEQDVLSRFVETARTYAADRIVRITSDCPLIDPSIIDSVVYRMDLNPQTEYACNFHPARRFPRGLDCEGMTRDLLNRLDQLASEPRHREHVTLYAYEHPEAFTIESISHETDWSHLRWTVDTPEDLVLIQQIYQYFGPAMFDWHDVISAYRQNPSWIHINENTVQKVA